MPVSVAPTGSLEALAAGGSLARRDVLGACVDALGHIVRRRPHRGGARRCPAPRSAQGGSRPGPSPGDRRTGSGADSRLPTPQVSERPTMPATVRNSRINRSAGGRWGAGDVAQQRVGGRHRGHHEVCHRPGPARPAHSAGAAFAARMLRSPLGIRSLQIAQFVNMRAGDAARRPSGGRGGERKVLAATGPPVAGWAMQRPGR